MYNVALNLYFSFTTAQELEKELKLAKAGKPGKDGKVGAGKRAG